MQIYWHGMHCIRIEASHGDQEATLVTDPYGTETGLRFPRTLAPDIVVLSHEDAKRFPMDGFTNKPFVISAPGEYEASGMFVFGIPLKGEGLTSPFSMIYRFEIEGMNVAFLGGLNRLLTQEEIGKLENIDILFLPVGGGNGLNPKQAVETITSIEPRVVIPMGHHVEGLKESLGTADDFCKELGVCRRQDSTKLKLLKKDLPADDLLVVVLERA